MKILITGAGGREHAIIKTIKRTGRETHDIFCANGNDGIATDARLVPIVPTDVPSLADFAAREKIDLTFVGSETALAAGIADEFKQRRLLIAAPSRHAAELESSKAAAKSFMQRYRIPTAHHRTVTGYREAETVLASGEFGASETPVVVKLDGLAAGKGVFVTTSHAAALRAVKQLTDKDRHARLVLEETLHGAECSLLIFTDGRDYKVMPAARDHKRLGEGDTGANTGGMGAITAPQILTAAQLQEITKTIIEPTLDGITREQLDYRGVLYFGLMMTPHGAKVLEYNARFGDPETQALLMRLESDLAEIFEAVARRKLSEVDVVWSNHASACVVLAARGYPQQPETGATIRGLENITESDDLQIFHAATTRENGVWKTNGGRVLGVTATGATLTAALATSYAAIDNISWDGMIYRRDIGATVNTPEG